MQNKYLRDNLCNKNRKDEVVAGVGGQGRQKPEDGSNQHAEGKTPSGF